MKVLSAGLVVALVTIFLCNPVPARAENLDHLEQLLEGVTLTYTGPCYFSETGTFLTTPEPTMHQRRCRIGLKLPDRTQLYVVVVVGDHDLAELYVYDREKKSQKVLWQGWWIEA